METNWIRVVILWGVVVIGIAVGVEMSSNDEDDSKGTKIMAERIVKVPYEQSP